MEPIAIVSDIHANLPAFEAVMQHIGTLGIERVICLGDLVGYGPKPGQCLDLAIRRCDVVVTGNHEFALLVAPVGLDRVSRDTIAWTRKELEPGTFSLPRTRRRWRFLRSLPERHSDNGVLFIHGAPQDPITCLTARDADPGTPDGSRKMKMAFELTERLCFIGHTHLPGVFESETRFVPTVELERARWDARNCSKAIVNVGSVGQPRDGDSRACYATFIDDRVRYHRVVYDIDKVIASIRRIPAIDNSVGERLRAGT
jgi:diadenosine tetraphosphatase ApaH/serine/threonine PP2A family protein phosphatase